MPRKVELEILVEPTDVKFDASEMSLDRTRSDDDLGPLEDFSHIKPHVFIDDKLSKTEKKSKTEELEARFSGPSSTSGSLPIAIHKGTIALQAHDNPIREGSYYTLTKIDQNGYMSLNNSLIDESSIKIKDFLNKRGDTYEGSSLDALTKAIDDCDKENIGSIIPKIFDLNPFVIMLKDGLQEETEKAMQSIESLEIDAEDQRMVSDLFDLISGGYREGIDISNKLFNVGATAKDNHE